MASAFASDGAGERLSGLADFPRARHPGHPRHPVHPGWLAAAGGHRWL